MAHASRHGRLTLAGPERLESREVLSANPTGAGLLAAALHHANAHERSAPAITEFDLGIRGTEVHYSPMGLPSYMAGDVYYVSAGSSSSSPIGHYEELLSPILVDVTGDGIPEFVGTTGVATFSFTVGASSPKEVGSFTTANVSFISGFTAEGKLLVGSTGTVVGATGLFTNLQGAFTSQSLVSMWPSFEMRTLAHFVADTSSCRLPANTVLSGLAFLNANIEAHEAPAERGRHHAAGRDVAAAQARLAADLLGASAEPKTGKHSETLGRSRLHQIEKTIDRLGHGLDSMIGELAWDRVAYSG